MKSKYFSISLLVLISILAVVYFLSVTEEGILLIDDSVRYLDGADHLASGEGYVRSTGDGGVKPIAGFPPGYPLMLSAWIAVGFDELSAAKILGCVFYFANTFLAGWLVFKYSRQLWLAALVSIGFAGKSSVLNHHIFAVAEPAYIFISLATVLVLMEYLQNQKKVFLFFLIILAGFAPLVRYNGINLLALVILALLIISREPWSKRLLIAGTTAVTGIIPIGLWFFRNMRMAGSATNRTLMYHPIPLPMIAEYVDEAISWFIPVIFHLDWRPRLSHLAGFLFVMIILFILLELRHIRKNFDNRYPGWEYRILPMFSLGFILSHMAIILFSTSFLDATMAAYIRYMVPVYVFSLIILACLLARWMGGKGKFAKYGRVGAAIGIILLGFHVQDTISSRHAFRENNHLESMRIVNLEASDFLREMDSSTTLISDDINLVYILTGRFAFMIPVKVDNYTLQENAGFQSAVDAYHERMEDGAVLIMTNHHLHNDEGRYAPAEKLINGLDVIFKGAGFDIYRHPDFVER